MIPSSAGPLVHATLIVGDLRPMVAAYTGLGLVASEALIIGDAQASAWGQPQLAGRRMLALLPTSGAAPLLRLIEVPGTPPRPTRLSHGWMALEILVRDVDDLAARLPAQGFEVVGAPADLDVSPHIRAMQVVGPAGEMLYLTQVKAPVAPFSIPMSSRLAPTQALGALFIAVMSTPSRAAALAACALLAPSQTLQFDTKITVLNRALGSAIDERWPVATAQFAGECLFEIDEIDHPLVGTGPPCANLPAGLAWIGIEVEDLPSPAGRAPLLELSSGAWIERIHGSR